MTDSLLDRLAHDLTPVSRPGGSMFFVHIGIGALLSAMVILFIATPRPDLGLAIGTAAFLWKFLAMATIALCSLVLLRRSGRPGGSTTLPNRLTWGLGAGLLLLPLVGAYIARGNMVMADMSPDLAARCVLWVSVAALPVWFAALTWLRRAAPTDLDRASWAAGLSSASVGATFFTLHCPYDSIAYVSIAYGASIIAIAAVTRIILPRLIRW